MLPEKPPGVFPSLADALALQGVPRSALLDHPELRADVQEIPFARDPFAVEDVELRLPEGGGELVLDDLDARAAPDDLVVLLDLRDPADVHADGGVELQGVAAGR